MQTVRQIERMWNARQYERLFRELVSFRPESEFALELQNGSTTTPAAAMAILRLDELGQSQASLYSKLLRCLLASQEADGGWDNPMLTALCLRALMAGRGSGEAIERGLAYLANLQKEEGIWPRIPFRRMPVDAFASAFIMYHLASHPRFAEVVAFDAAVEWFGSNCGRIETAAQKLWGRVSLRCGLTDRNRAISAQPNGWPDRPLLLHPHAMAG